MPTGTRTGPAGSWTRSRTWWTSWRDRGDRGRGAHPARPVGDVRDARAAATGGPAPAPDARLLPDALGRVVEDRPSPPGAAARELPERLRAPVTAAAVRGLGGRRDRRLRPDPVGTAHERRAGGRGRV